MGLALITPPTSQPITLEDLAGHARWEIDVDTFPRLTSALVAAVSFSEWWTRRQFISAAYRLKIAAFSDPIELPRAPLVSVESIKYIDDAGVEQVLATTVYEVDTTLEPGRIRRKYEQDWPDVRNQADAVTIDFTSGWANAAAVPDTLRHAIRLLAAHYIENPQAMAAIRSQEIPYGVRALLDSHLVIGAAYVA